MLRNLLFTTAIAGVSCISGSAIAQQFSSVVVFGDSLSDAGNLATTQPLPPGTSFTTNPDPVWVEHVAEEFGVDGEISTAGGSNYAWGQACVNPSGICSRGSQVPNTSQQITQHLAGGQADPNALYMIWAGGNDIDAIALNALTNPASAPSEIAAAATSLLQQVGRLKAAGARYVVVLSLPDPGRTPLAARLSAANPALQASLSQLGQGFNQAVKSGLANLGDGTIYVDVAALAEEVFQDAENYGFTSTQGVACPFGSNPARPEGGGESLVCGPTESGYLVAPDTTETYFFADGFHPSGASHELIANAVLASISAPLQVSMAVAGGKAVAESHRTLANNDMLATLGEEADQGAWRPYVGGSFAIDSAAALPRLGTPSGNAQIVTLGANYSAGPELILGAAASYGNYGYDVLGASLGNRSMLGSVQAAVRSGPVTIVGDFSFGRTSVEIERSIALGTATRVERGSTDVSQNGAEFSLDVAFAGDRELNHGLFIGATWLDQSMKPYKEVGTSSTAMNFTGSDRESLIARIGYRFNAMSSDGMFRPYGRIAFESEIDNTTTPVWGASNTFSRRFAVPVGAAPDDQWISTDIGFTAKINENANAYANFAGRFGGGLNDGRRISAGVTIGF